MKKILSLVNKIILVLSVYLTWTVILYEPYDDMLLLEAIPFTIVTIYVWKFLTKK